MPMFRRDMADSFRSQILNAKESSSIQAPVRRLGSVSFMYLRHNDIYVLGLTRNNANAMLAFKFMTPPPPPASGVQELEGMALIMSCTEILLDSLSSCSSV